MLQQTMDARQQFDRWSRHYDRDFLQTCFFQPAHAMLLEALRPGDGRILDVGCGTGIFAARVLERPGTEVWGLDLSAGMLRQAQTRCCTSQGHLHLVQGDSERLPFADGTFDAVTCTHSFHHYPRQGRVLTEMHRVLRPGGRLLLIDGDRDRPWGWLVFEVFVVLMEGPVRHLSARAFRESFRHAGFGSIRQLRRGGPLPFLMTVGRASKKGLPQVYFNPSHHRAVPGMHALSV
jgi:ubiquinone/menaquinone biosynthesis C-methylase UbiE